MRERESEKGWAEGAREREEKSNNAVSTGSLNDATLTSIWHFDKRGPDIVSSKTGLFFYYILFCRQKDKTPPSKFSCEFPEPFCDSPIIPIVFACIRGQKRSAVFFCKDSRVIFSKAYKQNHYFHSALLTLFCSLSPWPHSAESPAAILDSAHQSGGDARRERQPHLRSGGLTDAICQVDDGLRGADQGWRNADGPKRARSDQHTGVSQLHVHGHVISGCDRSNRSGHCKRWAFQFRL